jgi:glucose/arabinose dehydrogenase
MRSNSILFAPLLALAATLAAPTASSQTVESRLIGTFNRPTWAGAPEGDERIFVARRDGVIKTIKNGVILGTNFLSIKSMVSQIGERGLLGAAFHPEFKTNRYVFVCYSNGNNSVISRWTVKADNPDRVDHASELVILTQSQPFTNHNGGWIGFGPDGYLYIAFGDGGSANDPACRAQDPTTFLGKMLRIDVDSGSPYSVPADNPFVSEPGYLPEIWHLGLRNPWRVSFDRETGDMFIGDVGQDAREEISFAEAGQGGLNFGWKVKEGTKCNSSASCAAGTPGCASPTLTDPIFELTHGGGGAGSITGGFVYRGCAIPALAGTYVFSDYNDDKIRSFQYDVGTGTVNNLLDRTAELAPTSGAITNICSFGEDGFGELLIVEHLNTGQVFKIVPSGATAATNAVRNGGGTNVACLGAVTLPILGNKWVIEINPSTHANATAVGLVGFAAPTSGVFLTGGEALVDVTSRKIFQIITAAGTETVQITAPLPCDASLAGATGYTQAFILGGAGFELCNAVDLTLGYY